MLDRMLLASASDEKLFVEDCFATHLYTGNGSTQTITNGIDLAGKGGLVWIKSRSGAGTSHVLQDTVRGANNYLNTNNTNAQANADANFQFLSNGFSQNNGFTGFNGSGTTYASWTFRKAPKFFDVVTYTGNGSINQTISHNLGVAPGFIAVKCTSASGTYWICYHRSLGDNYTVFLNTTDAAFNNGINTWSATSTSFNANNNYNSINANGATYVAYLFAHDATADGIIQCGSFVGSGSSTSPTEINLGWEPQWLLVKGADIATGWVLEDNMRGMPVGGEQATLYANTSGAEFTLTNTYPPTATGFQSASGGTLNGAGKTYIYIAIRRGPMKTPTVGTSVFSPIAYSGTGSPQLLSAGFPMDIFLDIGRDSTAGTALSGYQWPLFTRLLGNANALETTNTDPWAGGWGDSYLRFDNNLGTQLTTSTSYMNSSGATYISYQFRRAPGFFDVVCYTGTGASATFNHNLGVVPELMIFKGRTTTTGSWATYAAPLGSAAGVYLNRNDPSAAVGSAFWASTPATTTSFSVTSSTVVNGSGNTYVAYLFASCPGVSKVGSYTGNGSSQTINCGFSSGARFFLVKRTDSTGDWWVYDSARGIVAAADPALRLNSTAAEVTSADAVDTDSTGIIVNQEATCNINVNGATYIYLAIA